MSCRIPSLFPDILEGLLLDAISMDSAFATSQFHMELAAGKCQPPQEEVAKMTKGCIKKGSHTNHM